MDRLCVDYDIGVTALSLPPLILQPLVENAVRHGVTMQDEGGTVTITTRETEADFVIAVADDGVGFSEHDLLDTGRSHMGIQNVRERLRMICAGTLTITSIPEQGTTATITIPKEVDIV